MSSLKIEIQNYQLSYKPGEKIRGKVSWSLDKTPSKAFVRLIWFTKISDDDDDDIYDEEIHSQIQLEQPYAQDSRSFEFKAPDYPLSFNGKLFSIHWAIELTVARGSSRIEICISPTNAPLTTIINADSKES